MPNKEYYWNHRDRYLASSREYRESNREKCRADGREYYYKNQERMKLRAIISHRKKRHGWTEQEYNDAFRKQLGCCAICGTHQNNLKRALHADHCHKTGRRRELLCAHCNCAIGYLKEDERILQNVIDYLRRHNES